jgi:hypothetical protein
MGQKAQPGIARCCNTAFVRIPGDGDQRSEVMAITIPK